MEPLQTWWTTELYPTSDEDNFGVVGNFEVVKAADAQATIAALQAVIRQMGEQAAVLAKDGMAAKAQVAALQAVKADAQDANRLLRRELSKLREKYDAECVMSEGLQAQLTQRTAELEAAKAIQAIDLKNNNAYREQVATLQAELERVRGLVKALPKVEGEIAVKHTEVDLSYVWGITLNGYFTFQSALFDGKEEAEAYATILKHRQGMEG